MNVVSCENTAVKRWAVASVHIANVHKHLEWLHVKSLLSFFSADCLRSSYPDETIWKLHTLTATNSCLNQTAPMCSYFPVMK